MDFILTFVYSICLEPLFIISAIFLFNVITREVNYPFIDEIFHVPQCQWYCQQYFSYWDPKITTPPGLYYLGYGFSSLVRLIDGDDSYCSLNQLRSLNYIGGVYILPLVLKLCGRYPAYQFPIANLISFPLLTLYFSLFYTDSWSTILVVSSLVVGLEGYNLLSAILGLLSITFRQTNVVWNGLILAILLDRKIYKNYTGNIIQDGILFVKAFFNNFMFLTLPFVINFIAFLVFLVHNNWSITFGDKENHAVGFHAVQLFYCSTFMCLFSAPIWLSPKFIKNYCRSFFISPFKVFILFLQFAIIYGCIQFFTVVHPFLLSDNRHYTFYIWRKIINRSAYTRFYLIPIYHFSLYTVLKLMKLSGQNSITSENLSFSPITIICYFICCCATIIPSPLFETRYYILPFLLWRLMIRPVNDPLISKLEFFKKYNSVIRLVLEYFLFNAVNFFVFYMFLNYTFEWENEPSAIQRIIW
ncbi:hypothetical protein PACTADRAFT_77351 [Pachysolen tannophilus NRRL Y-2460]|uniref:Dol-P-Glc:Glc(2)Man(9)GlcNAc(2)-PP-Dol alpha-1,2-glucosyltransferase n=1 Tax=Pachysolen tannophilus NRRL Y-2460 TaxID=669874 RepID=A0A1E4TQ21_PACTA|nr:hypothetical protein PACTADRAFT_77351 [Pachysolen tannophilus NRRL Y-2460]